MYGVRRISEEQLATLVASVSTYVDSVAQCETFALLVGLDGDPLPADQV